MKYVWFNINTGEFSDSWNENEIEAHFIENIKDEGLLRDELKLIKFKCISDPNFKFVRHMKIIDKRTIK